MAAAAGSLLAVSTVVAFKGWPDVPDPLRAASPALLVASPPSVGRTAAAAAGRLPTLVLGSGRAPGARSSSLRLSRRGSSSSSAAAGRPARIGAQNTASAPGAGAGSTSTPSSSTASESSATVPADVPSRITRHPADPVRQTTQTLGGTVDGATQAVGQAVEPVVPGLGTTVQGAGGIVGNTVKGVGGLLGGLLDGVLAPRADQPGG